LELLQNQGDYHHHFLFGEGSANAGSHAISKGFSRVLGQSFLSTIKEAFRAEAICIIAPDRRVMMKAMQVHHDLVFDIDFVLAL
jgi:hypothetical protein